MADEGRYRIDLTALSERWSDERGRALTRAELVAALAALGLTADGLDWVGPRSAMSFLRTDEVEQATFLTTDRGVTFAETLRHPGRR
jgi:hypothetical protein